MLDINDLRQIPVFAKLPEERLQWLCEQGIEVWLQPGEIHRAEGDPADHVFVMLEGEMQVTQKVGNQDILLATYGSKTLFGELPILLYETRRSNSSEDAYLLAAMPVLDEFQKPFTTSITTNISY